MSTNTQDSADLEALFDSIAAKTAAASAQAKESGVEPSADASMLEQIGRLTRILHDALRELGLNKEIEKAVATIPDARDRLNYVATLTQKAAERVLNATDTAQPVVDKIGKDCKTLSTKWQMLFDGQLNPEQFKFLVLQTRQFFDETPARTAIANAQLMEIMMAQDFQDLTGQVIKKIVDINRQMEQQLVRLLLDSAPEDVKAGFDAESLQNGPVINAEGRNDVVTNQNQVDELLASMGF